ncbi:hypothetical protein HanIR_Chr10g0487731 [Helianthus annuus]|nr:hypothetical protein HanIR_Chr10g0487731 [Helianthus annuus]
MTTQRLWTSRDVSAGFSTYTRQTTGLQLSLWTRSVSGGKLWFFDRRLGFPIIVISGD